MALRSEPHWFGEADRPLLGWLTAPTHGAAAEGVVLLPPLAYEYWSTHRALRTLAERMASRGRWVLRIDYDGTGDSAGTRWDDDRVARWRGSVVAAVREMRRLGMTKVTLAGLRLGATFALLEAHACAVDAVLAWVPIASGKRFGRELRMLGLAVPEGEHAGAIVYAGTAFSTDTLDTLAAIDLDELVHAPARALIITRPDRPADRIANRLRALGCAVDVRALPGSERVLDVPSEDAVVPDEIIDALATWLPEVNGSMSWPTLQPRALVAWGDGAVTETVTRVAGLVGVLGAPLGQHAQTTIVFLNSGSEVHVGPGRAWVEYARALNLAGYRTLRIDYSGWGESEDRGHAPGRPYDAQSFVETAEIVAALRTLGHERVVLIGLCWSAWVAMRVALDVHVDGIVAINPQLYWELGDPTFALLADTRKRRTPEREREERGRKSGWWSVLDLFGLRPQAGRWLMQLRRRHIPTLLLFAAGDDGVEFLRNRVSRRLERELRTGIIELVEIADVDHQMYREWRRTDVVAAIRAFVDRVSGEARRQ